VSQRDFAPPGSEATAAYWSATRSRTLVLQRCRDCGRLVHHPREACPFCLSLDLAWHGSAGEGTIHAVSVHHRAFEAMDQEDCPYVVAFIDLDDGVRFLSNVVGPGRLGAAVGDRVRLSWIPVADGYHLPVFELAGTSALTGSAGAP